MNAAEALAARESDGNAVTLTAAEPDGDVLREREPLGVRDAASEAVEHREAVAGGEANADAVMLRDATRLADARCVP